ncbi:hypothetical protein OS493_034695 [Desmophyllum pertusum]|uniref:Uncharacterized protein n=1 Tax=Desmophyllum pertusum TaxID=174260 RepID=A0A9W9Z9C4_9CNID|nr:hypothetical protein OS493_034695 [Desmophyllum pertusum]
MNEYFQIDLLRVRHVSAIATQGVVSGRFWSYYVETYMIKYSYDGWSWLFYEADNGANKIFFGNTDANSVKKNYFRDTFVTRYLRIYPKSHNRDMCLRVELYGCSDQADDCSRYITSPTGSITSPGHPVNYPSNKDCTWIISSQVLLIKDFRFDYLSVTPGLNDVLAVKACDEDVIALDCSSFDYTINILHAVYGSFPYSCGQQSTTTTCPALDTKIAQMGPAKRQLEVFYQCTSTSIKTPAPTTPSPPPTPAQRSTVAPSTVQTPTTTNNQHSNSFTGNTTGLSNLNPHNRAL